MGWIGPVKSLKPSRRSEQSAWITLKGQGMGIAPPRALNLS